MDRDKDRAQVGRLEVVETGRRRRWSEDEKLRIVLESLQGTRRVSATARRYGISRSLLLKWRRLFRAEEMKLDRDWTSFRRLWLQIRQRRLIRSCRPAAA